MHVACENHPKWAILLIIQCALKNSTASWDIPKTKEVLFWIPPQKNKGFAATKPMPNKIFGISKIHRNLWHSWRPGLEPLKNPPFWDPRQEGLGMLHRENCQKKHTALIVGDFTRELVWMCFKYNYHHTYLPKFWRFKDHSFPLRVHKKLFQILRLLIFWLKIFQAKGLFFCLFWISRFPPSRGMGLQRLGSPDRISWGSRQLGIWPTMSWLSASFFWV